VTMDDLGWLEIMVVMPIIILLVAVVAVVIYLTAIRRAR